MQKARKLGDKSATDGHKQTKSVKDLRSMFESNIKKAEILLMISTIKGGNLPTHPQVCAVVVPNEAALKKTQDKTLVQK